MCLSHRQAAHSTTRTGGGEFGCHATYAAGVPATGFHDLRRAATTALLLEGVDVKTAQVRLGHSDPRLTIAVYAQATNEGDRNATAKLGARFFPKPVRLKVLEQEIRSSVTIKFETRATRT